MSGRDWLIHRIKVSSIGVVLHVAFWEMFYGHKYLLFNFLIYVCDAEGLCESSLSSHNL